MGCTEPRGALGPDALNGAVSKAAWRSKPSWHLLVTDDRMIPVGVQRLTSKRAGSEGQGTRARGAHWADLRRARMKAVRLLEYGGQLVFKDVPTPTIGRDEILVKG